MSAFPLEADASSRLGDVGFVPKADIVFPRVSGRPGSAPVSGPSECPRCVERGSRLGSAKHLLRRHEVADDGNDLRFGGRRVPRENARRRRRTRSIIESDGLRHEAVSLSKPRYEKGDATPFQNDRSNISSELGRNARQDEALALWHGGGGTG
jgi:hypothetical protein